ncbi:MAG: hypothetical protein ABSG59_01150 [Verrucomicrobiota bacterium]|jgi:hypothetical protein
MSDFDSAGALSKSAPKSLAAFLAAGAERARLWRPDELGAIFRHQMAAPILVDLAGFDPATASRLKTLSDAQNLLLKSFLDLFLHPVPPLELLSLTKDFAKINMDHPDSSLPREIAAVLYYASIAAALARLDTRISQLTDPELARGMRWAGDQPWVSQPIRDLLAQARLKLEKNGPAPASTK